MCPIFMLQILIIINYHLGNQQNSTANCGYGKVGSNIVGPGGCWSSVVSRLIVCCVLCVMMMLWSEAEEGVESRKFLHTSSHDSFSHESAESERFYFTRLDSREKHK